MGKLFLGLVKNNGCRLCEYFLGEFAKHEGRKGGVIYTPESIAKLIVKIIEPCIGSNLRPIQRFG